MISAPLYLFPFLPELTGVTFVAPFTILVWGKQDRHITHIQNVTRPIHIISVEKVNELQLPLSAVKN